MTKNNVTYRRCGPSWLRGREVSQLSVAQAPRAAATPGGPGGGTAGAGGDGDPGGTALGGSAATQRVSE